MSTVGVQSKMFFSLAYNFVPHFKNYGAASACMLLCYEHCNGNLSVVRIGIVLHPRRTDPPMRTPSAV